MRTTMRRTAATLAAALILVTHLGAAEAQESLPKRTPAQAMSPSEDASLARRAALNPELEGFKGGYLDAFGYAAAAAIVVGFSVAVGHLIACPLGWTHSTQGKTFVPADTLNGPSKTENYFNFCGAILGIPLYSLGYLMGLAVARPEPPPNGAVSPLECEAPPRTPPSPSKAER